MSPGREYIDATVAGIEADWAEADDMTTTDTHPAAESGHPWRGATWVAVRDAVDEHTGMLIAAKGELADVVGTCRSGEGLYLSTDHAGTHDLDGLNLDDWALVLDDPLSLGLAGLAARVAERGGPVWRPLWLQDLLGVRFSAHDPDRDREAVCALASYYALTDRLCALVGLELAEGEVARWEQQRNRSDGSGVGRNGWVLWAHQRDASGWRSFPGTLHTWAETSNPLTALRAACAGMEADHADD